MLKSNRYFIFLSIFAYGCTSYHCIGIKSGILALEDGTLREYNVKSVLMKPFFPSPGGIREIIVPAEEQTKHADLATLWHKSPLWHDLTASDSYATHPMTLLGVVGKITAEVPPKKIRWIIGLKPVIVAIGTEEEWSKDIYGSMDGPDTINIEGTDELVFQKDMQRKIEAVYVS